MAGVSTIAYAQARIQTRYGERADARLWLKLHNIQDLGSYLQTAQQTALRPWVLGLSTSHTSHAIELALRQKYRHHVDEVAGWMPGDWQESMQWIKRLADLPVLQYLAAGGEPLHWMASDSDISGFTGDEPLQRLQAMRQAGYRVMVDTWQQRNSILSGWIAQWDSMRPKSVFFERGLQALEKLLHEQLRLQTKQQGLSSSGDYDIMLDRLRLIFRRYTFQPAAVTAYLVMIATDIHRVRSDLMQRLFFVQGKAVAEGLPQ
ncbi:MAG: hypothetical protein WBO14_14560 [Gammaproteobacteria bacterium]